jgi:hypothetical protein
MLTEKVSLGPSGQRIGGRTRHGGPRAMKSAILATSGGFLGPGRVSGHSRRGAGVRRAGLGAVSHVTFVRIGRNSSKDFNASSAMKKFRRKKFVSAHTKRKTEACQRSKNKKKTERFQIHFL